MPRIVRAEYLSYCNSARNSDKLFNIFLIQEDDGTFSCLTENGRRGSNLVRRNLCTNTRRETAQNLFREKFNAKRDHRETPYTDEKFGYNYSQIASEYGFGSDANSSNRRTKTENSSTAPSIKSNVIAFPVEEAEKSAVKPKPNGLLNSEQFDSLEF